MALSRPLFLGFSGASKEAREGGNVEVTVDTEEGPRAFTLPWFVVRQVDALLERWRREAHEASLMSMNGGALGMTLWQAAGAGGLRDTTFLLSRGADVNYMLGGISALWTSAFSGHLEVVAALIDAGGAGGLDQALYVATQGGRNPALVALLLDRGADLHYLNDAPLRNAAGRGCAQTVRLLLDRGALVHSANKRALRRAQEAGHAAVVALLLERGAIDQE